MSRRKTIQKKMIRRLNYLWYKDYFLNYIEDEWIEFKRYWRTKRTSTSISRTKSTRDIRNHFRERMLESSIYYSKEAVSEFSDMVIKDINKYREQLK